MRRDRTSWTRAGWLCALPAAILVAAVGPTNVMRGSTVGPPRVLIAALSTGGASASDEYVELANADGGAVSLAGLELLYVSASGATVSARAAWDASAPSLASGARLLLANAEGAYAAIADLTYAGGLAAPGGSLVLRRATDAAVIDVVGWGSVTSAWREGSPAPAPPAGSSLLRRLGPDGSLVDTGDNAADFVVAAARPPDDGPPTEPSPSSEPTSPPPTPSTSTPTPTPDPMVGASPTPSPLPSSMQIAAARALPEGTRVTVKGVALAGSSFHDGGGFLADASGGIAVLVADGSFDIGATVIATGVLDTRFGQTTLRVEADDIVPTALDLVVTPQPARTGELGESLEARLVRTRGTIRAMPTRLAAGLAFDVDDGTGVARVIVADATGIATGRWIPGATVELVGIVGQRDSTGAADAGYRLLPRTASDVVAVEPPEATPSPSPSVAPSSPPAVPRDSRVSIREARRAAAGATVVVRGAVTLAPGIVAPDVAVLQDSTGAIVVRPEPGTSLPQGRWVQVEGTRSTRSGMETIRLSAPPSASDAGDAVAPRAVSSGEVGESFEAQLVRVAGVLGSSARRASSGTVSFDLDDGSGPVRVVAPAALDVDDGPLVAGALVEVIGVVGQETTGAAPTAGYRIWPRSAAEIRLLSPAPPDAGEPAAGRSGVGGSSARGEPVDATRHADLGALSSAAALANLRIGATLVVGAWAELGIGGLLWDGERLVAISLDSAPALAAVSPVTLPRAIELTGLVATGVEPLTGVTVVSVPAADAVASGHGPVAPPLTAVPTPGAAPAWVALVGVLREDSAVELPGSERVAIDHRCASPPSALPPGSPVRAVGIALADPLRLIVPCEGLRAAPALVRGTEPPDARPRTLGTSAALPAVAPSGPEHAARRQLAGGFLAAGAMILLAGLGAVRRFTTAAEPDDAAPDEAAPDDAPATEHPRPLRLLPLRRERGP